jgi:hypothetical protein
MATTIYPSTIDRAPSRISSRVLAGVAALALAAGAFQLGRVEVQHTTTPSAPSTATVSAQTPAPITGPSAAQFQLAQAGRPSVPVYGCTPTNRVRPC